MSEILDVPPSTTRPDDLPDEPAGRTAGSYWRDELRPLLRRVHYSAGLFIGPFLLVAALTGLLYTLTPQLEQWVHHDQLHVPVPAGGAPLPLSGQVAAATAAVPGAEVMEIRPAATPDGTTRVMFDASGVPQDYSRTAFVDPYTGTVRGVLTTYGEWLPVRAWIDELHRTLHLGAVGRVYSELAASWLWVLTLSGLAVWISRRTTGGRGGTTHRMRRLLTPRVRGRGRARLRSWHGSVGLWAAAGLLFLSATGLTWSQFAGPNVTAARHALSWSTPDVSTALPGAATGGTTAAAPVAATGGATAADPAALPGQAERALAAARAAGLSDPVALTPPARPGRAWVVGQTQRSWPEKQDSMAVDPATGAVLDTVRFADWPLAAKLARWGVDAHMGLLFGWVSQVALAALALGLTCLIVWGYRMWWRRRPRATGAPGERDGDGRDQQSPTVRALLPVGAAAVLVGVFLPLLGGSLLVFLLLDAVLGQVRDRGQRAAAATVEPDPA
jgi:uncharacterized iron-regulated membrane protein